MSAIKILLAIAAALAIIGGGACPQAGAVVNFALHACTVGKQGISADYPYCLERSLRQELGEQFLSIYAAGAGRGQPPRPCRPTRTSNSWPWPMLLRTAWKEASPPARMPATSRERAPGVVAITVARAQVAHTATLADESVQQGIERDHRDAGNHVGRGER